jgi:hypothetical protein
MKKTALVSLVAAGLALVPVSGLFAATNPAAPNPTPARESKSLVDFESAVTPMSDPTAAGTNVASINTDPQFVAEGSKSLKLDLNGVMGYYNNYFVVPLPAPVDIKGYQVLAMDVFVPDTSIDPTSYYQFDPHPTTTSPTDDTMTSDTYYGPGSMHAGWNHLIWTLKDGTDNKVTQLSFAGNAGAPYTGPVYVDNIRVYKGNFVGLQPDEKVIMGFDKPTDASFFTSGDGAPITVNTDKQFISQGSGSLEIDLTGLGGGYSSSVANADDWGMTLDASKATALHLDIFVPAASYTVVDYDEVGFSVVGDGGTVNGFSNGVESVNGQWITMEIPLTPDDAAKLTNVKGISLIRNSGSAWTGPIYIDNLRAVFPTAPAAGQ